MSQATFDDDIIKKSTDKLVKQACQKLHQSSIFSGDEFDVDFLQKQITEGNDGLSIMTIKGNETLILEGDTACQSFYVFIHGKFNIFVGGKRITETSDLIEAIGEVGFMDPENGRIATVIADSRGENTENTLIRIERKFIEKTLGAYPSKQLRIYRNLAREMAGKLDATNKMIHAFKQHPECAKKLQTFLQEPLKENPWGNKRRGDSFEQLAHGSEAFRDIDPDVLGRIITGNNQEQPNFLHLKPGEIIMSPTHGDRDRFYVVLSGGLDVCDKTGLVGSIGPMGVAGEVSFMNPDLGRIATVSATDFSKTPIFISDALASSSKGTILLELRRDYINQLDIYHQIAIYRNLARSIGRKLGKMNQVLKRIHESSGDIANCDDILGHVTQKIGELI